MSQKYDDFFLPVFYPLKGEFTLYRKEFGMHKHFLCCYQLHDIVFVAVLIF